MDRSPHELIVEFREAISAIYPILRRIGAIESDEQLYDDYDLIAEAIWNVIVCTTLGWQAGLDRALLLPRYGFSKGEAFAEGKLVAKLASGKSGRFVQLIGDKTFGDRTFNAVDLIDDKDETFRVPFTEITDVSLLLSEQASG